MDTFKPPSNVWTDERILVLKVKEGMKAKSSTGVSDPRLFTGENNLVVYKEDGRITWRLRFKNGISPQAFDQRFTSFPKALAYAKEYFSKRNCDIVEVQSDGSESR